MDPLRPRSKGYKQMCTRNYYYKFWSDACFSAKQAFENHRDQAIVISYTSCICRNHLNVVVSRALILEFLTTCRIAASIFLVLTLRHSHYPLSCLTCGKVRWPHANISPWEEICFSFSSVSLPQLNMHQGDLVLIAVSQSCLCQIRRHWEQ